MRSEPGNSGRIVRAVYRACSVPDAAPPYDRVLLKIFYPAQPDGGEEQMNAGIIPADPSGAPYPVVIIMPGNNVGPEAYAWLAERIALHGFVVISYTMVAEELPGYVCLTPGLDISAVTPSTWGKGPSATALGTILDCIGSENESGLLRGRIDTDKVVLAGHSAGGSVALFNADRDWFPSVCGAVSYGAHAGASTMLGFDTDTILELPGREPLMVIGGTRDGVIAESGHRYGIEHKDPLYLIRRTFEDGIADNREDSWLVEIQGANHFSIAHPTDVTTGRPYLDWAEEGDGSSIRSLIADLIIEFASLCCGRSAANIRQFEDKQLITLAGRTDAAA